MTLPKESPEYYRESELAFLTGQGVRLPAPGHVAIHRSVPLEHIARGAVLHPFTRLSGTATRIGTAADIGKGGPATLHNAWVGERAVIGELGPVTLRDCTAGPGTVLGCGVAEEAVLLGKEGSDPTFTAGFGFRVRRGSLYEEDANSAQFTDTKMTILLPWVTLGSGLNWCDVLVAGGIGPGLGQFSEVGSGAIHFNFTPRGDKATASLLGNVVDGVFLDQPRLFMGGNTSLVGPVTAAFGAVTAAGGRHGGALGPGLNAPTTEVAGDAAFDPDIYGSVQRVVGTQIVYIGELAALEAWYGHARPRLAAGRPDRADLYRRAQTVVQVNLRERIAQLEALAARMPRSAEALNRRAPGDPRIAQQRALHEQWPALRRHLERWSAGAAGPPAALTDALDRGAAREPTYTRIIQGLPEAAKTAGRTWLRSVRDQIASPQVLGTLPALGRL